MRLDAHPVQVRGEPGASQREPGRGREAQARPAEQELETRGARRIAEQAVAERESAAIHGARDADPVAEVARSAEVLHESERPRLDDVKAHGTASKRTRVPGESSAAGSRAASQSTASVLPISCQPPGEARG